jgi:tetratricopeptide (TPR) repeat protein
VDAIIRGEKAVRSIEAGDVQLARLYGGSIAALVNAGEMAHARVFADVGMQHALRSGNRTVLATCYFGKAETIAADDPDGAIAAFDEAIKLGREGAYSTITGPALYQSAYLRLGKGDDRAALRDLRQAVAVLWDSGQEPQLNGAFGFASEMLVLTGHPTAAFVVVGAIVGGALQALRAMPVPPERDPAATFARAREQISEQERKEAMQAGAAMSYAELVVWLLSTLDAALAASRP